MKQGSLPHWRTNFPSRNSGFTLVELLVVMVIALVLILAVLIMQSHLTQANMQLTDTSQRNNQVRAAMNLLNYDVSNSLFMLNGTTPGCSVTLQYLGDRPDPVTAIHAVTAQEQPAVLATTSTLKVASLSPNVFSAKAIGGSNVSHMLSIALVPTAVRAPSARMTEAFQYKVVLPDVATSPEMDAVNAGVLPLNSTEGIQADDALTLLVDASRQRACLRFNAADMRVPALDTSNTVKTYGTVRLPDSAHFGVFNAALLKAGFLTEPLRNTQFVRAKLKNDGPTSDAHHNLQNIAYYVARLPNSGEGTMPALVRATIKVDGTLAGQPVPVAAGVVSLQALYGVDAAGLGTVTTYITWDQVTRAKLTGQVRSVLLALVSRTLQSHPNNPLVQSVVIPSPNANTNDATFAPYFPANAAEQRDRYWVLTAEIALRNKIRELE